MKIFLTYDEKYLNKTSKKLALSLMFNKSINRIFIT